MSGIRYLSAGWEQRGGQGRREDAAPPAPGGYGLLARREYIRGMRAWVSGKR